MEIKVSVVTTLYNYRKYIHKTIKSFLKQNFSESEMIIVDDASTDNPYKIIKRYESDRVIYVPLDKNMGYSHAKNVGIKKSRGEILVMLDADDMLMQRGISVRYDKIIQGYDFVHGPCLDFKNDELKRSKMWSQWKKHKTYKYVHAQGVMLRKEIHRRIGLYDETLRCKSDREMFARVFNHGFKIGTVSDNVAIYRRHASQMHKSKEKLKINKQLQEQVLKKIEDRKVNLNELEML
jgi:glycosyltransferase involved in cell wall biosynthesis